MLCTTVLEIEPAGGPVQKCETDFVIFTQQYINHKVQIAIGECKNRGEITEDDVAKPRMVAEALEKKDIQVYVIFAKLSDFTSEELVRCQAINGKYERRLILFTARELEPYFLYEKTKEEFDIQGYAISLEDMANTTHTVFYAHRKHTSMQEPPLQRMVALFHHYSYR